MVSVTGRNECSLSWPEEKQQLHKQIFFSYHEFSGSGIRREHSGMVSLYSVISGTTAAGESTTGASSLTGLAVDVGCQQRPPLG